MQSLKTPTLTRQTGAMRVHVLQHVPFEGLGSIAGWLDAHGVTPTWTRFFDSADLPDPESVDLVIAMGGPMSVNDEAELPWLRDEKIFIAEAISQGKAVLGICLGAQLIASALGARVAPGTHKEIGWFDIENVASIANTFRFPERMRVFHWHGETFDLPRNAARIARSTVCANQAFQLGERILGLQFHLETTPESARAIIEHSRGDLTEGAWIQREEALGNAPPHAYAEINRVMAEVLDYLAGGVMKTPSSGARA